MKKQTNFDLYHEEGRGQRYTYAATRTKTTEGLGSLIFGLNVHIPHDS